MHISLSVNLFIVSNYLHYICMVSILFKFGCLVFPEHFLACDDFEQRTEQNKMYVFTLFSWLRLSPLLMVRKLHC